MPANSWGTNPITLQVAADDTAYDPAEDVKNGGDEYSTMRYFIQSIRIEGGSNGQKFTLQHCTPDGSVEARNTFLDITIETGDLNKVITFPKGLWVNGIYPKAIPGGTVVIDLF